MAFGVSGASSVPQCVLGSTSGSSDMASHAVGPHGILPVVHHHLVVLADCAESNEFVIGRPGNPEQAGAPLSRGAPGTLERRFPCRSARERATVLDDLRDTQRFAEESRLVARQ